MLPSPHMRARASGDLRVALAYEGGSDNPGRLVHGNFSNRPGRFFARRLHVLHLSFKNQE